MERTVSFDITTYGAAPARYYCCIGFSPWLFFCLRVDGMLGLHLAAVGIRLRFHPEASGMAVGSRL